MSSYLYFPFSLLVSGWLVDFWYLGSAKIKKQCSSSYSPNIGPEHWRVAIAIQVICNSSEYAVFFYKVLLDVQLMCMYSKITYERLNNNVDRCINRNGFDNINKWLRTAVTK